MPPVSTAVKGPATGNNQVNVGKYGGVRRVAGEGSPVIRRGIDTGIGWDKKRLPSLDALGSTRHRLVKLASQDSRTPLQALEFYLG